ncbi:hypothetical protein ACPV5I_03805 [Vibrio gigantis]
MNKIKVYNYEAIDKFYIGWEWYQQVTGLGLPANSTEIEPPTFDDGFIPVFNGTDWIVMEDCFWRPNYIEKIYYSGRNRDTYEPLCLSAIAGDFPAYPDLPQVCNSQLVSILIAQKVRSVQEKYRELVNFHSNFTDPIWLNSIPFDGPKEYIINYSEQSNRLYKYHFIAEEMVASIRSAIDYLIQLTFMLTSYSDYMSNKVVSTDSIGKFLQQLNNNKLSEDIKNIVIGNDGLYESDSTNYLKHINDLSNSIKHSMMHSEAFSHYCPDFPTIVSFQASNNNHTNEIVYHNHSACQLVIGFQNTVKRVFKNQTAYIKI